MDSSAALEVDDTLETILSFLPPKSITTAALVSPTWYRATREESLWKKLCTRDKIPCIPGMSARETYTSVYGDFPAELGGFHVVELRKHTSGIRGLSYCHDQQKILTGSDDKLLGIW